MKNDSRYQCIDHKLNIVCVGCVKALIAQHEILLKFVNKHASLHEHENKLFALQEAGYVEIDSVIEARNILKLIGEIPHEYS